jgi:hypothetical protein
MVGEGAEDTYDCLNAIDRWLVGGIIGRIYDVCEEQHWPDAELTLLKMRWKEATGLEPGGGFYNLGYGWRVWYADGQVLDSRSTSWKDLPDGIVLGVSYNGEQRWMAQGRDPYCLMSGLLFDSRTTCSPLHLDSDLVKQGVWVSAAEMRRIRLLAVKAFLL